MDRGENMDKQIIVDLLKKFNDELNIFIIDVMNDKLNSQTGKYPSFHIDHLEIMLELYNQIGVNFTGNFFLLERFRRLFAKRFDELPDCDDFLDGLIQNIKILELHPHRHLKQNETKITEMRRNVIKTKSYMIRRNCMRNFIAPKSFFYGIIKEFFDDLNLSYVNHQIDFNCTGIIIFDKIPETCFQISIYKYYYGFNSYFREKNVQTELIFVGLYHLGFNFKYYKDRTILDLVSLIN